MKTKLRYLISLCAAVFFASAVSGCQHTAHGVGQDIERMGEKIQDKTN